MQVTGDVLVGPNRLPEGLKDDTTPDKIKDKMEKLMAEKKPEGGTRSRTEAAFDVCLDAASHFGYALQVRRITHKDLG